jgi:D-3-phosphoglycerate dehydrogenase
MKKTVIQADTLHPLFKQKIESAGIVVIEAFEESAEEILKRHLHFHGLAIRSRFKIDRNFLEHAKGLECIGRAGAGMENIDTAFAISRNISCVNAPEGNRDAVAEHAIGMLLAMNNHLMSADAEVRHGIWRREENRGDELEGKTVGIVGFGNMGRAFARRLSGFGVRILVLDPYLDAVSVKAAGAELCDESLFFQECDIVSLHIPLNDETHYLVNRVWLSRFRKPIKLINTARGKNVDTEALVDALETGSVVFAALDVLEYETLSFEQLDPSSLPAAFRYLVNSSKVILSPHIAGWSHESNEKIARILAEKMIAVLLR